MTQLTVIQDQVVEQVIKWLSPVDPKDTFDTVAKARVATSGDWITRTIPIRRWIESSTSTTFWLNGISTQRIYSHALYSL